MNTYVDICVFFLWGIIELINVYMMANTFLALEKKKPSINCVITCAVLYISVWVTFFVASSKDFRGLIGFLYVPFILKSLIMIFPFYKVKIKTGLMVFFFMLISSTLASNIGIICKAVGFQSLADSQFNLELIASIIVCLSFLVLLFIKNKLGIHVFFAELEYIDYFLFIVITYTVSIIETAMFLSSKYSNVARTFAVIAYVSVAVLIFRSIVTLARKSYLEGINRLLENQMKQTTEYYYELVEKEQSTKKFRHDIKNLLIGLYSLIEENQNEKALGYIKELQDITAQGSSKYNSGNFIADAILTAKAHRGEKDNTEIELNGFMPSQKVADSDIVIIMSNLLDNAIEACEKINGKKTIVIDSVLRKNMWILVVTNPSWEVTINDDFSIPTSKEEKDIHGFGLNNVNKVAKKYNGDFTVEYDEGIFKSTVKLMLE